MKYFMILRISHWAQLFDPVYLYFDKVSKATKVSKEKYMLIVQLEVFILVLGHYLACAWIIIGNRDPIKYDLNDPFCTTVLSGGKTWLY